MQVVVGYGDTPESKLACIDIAEIVGHLGLDEVFEATNGVRGCRFDGEGVRCGLPIDETKQGQRVHGPAQCQ